MPGQYGEAVSTIIQRLREDVESFRREAPGAELSIRRRRQMNEEIKGLCLEIEGILRDADPVKLPPAMFDPGNPDLVGRFIALALVAQPRLALASVGDFYGAGVYAIYYHGPHEAYAPISGKEVPIYVGKADPDSALAKTPIEQKTKLSGRLKDHRRSILKVATTLDVNDFYCRYLVVQSGWEKPAESFLINFFTPVWNSQTGICYGLGKHGDSALTRANKRSPWDTLHPGREWARKSLEDAISEPTILRYLADHFEDQARRGMLYSDITGVLNVFMAGLRFSGSTS